LVNVKENMPAQRGSWSLEGGGGYEEDDGAHDDVDQTAGDENDENEENKGTQEAQGGN